MFYGICLSKNQPPIYSYNYDLSFQFNCFSNISANFCLLITRGTFTFRELQSSGPVFDAQMKPDDPAVIIQSSGSTGNPKSVVLSHGNVVSAAYQSFSTMRLRHSVSIILVSNVLRAMHGQFYSLFSQYFGSLN